MSSVSFLAGEEADVTSVDISNLVHQMTGRCRGSPGSSRQLSEITCRGPAEKTTSTQEDAADLQAQQRGPTDFSVLQTSRMTRAQQLTVHIFHDVWICLDMFLTSYEAWAIRWILAVRSVLVGISLKPAICI